MYITSYIISLVQSLESLFVVFLSDLSIVTITIVVISPKEIININQI